jgi:hypothetical protein
MIKYNDPMWASLASFAIMLICIVSIIKLIEYEPIWALKHAPAVSYYDRVTFTSDTRFELVNHKYTIEKSDDNIIDKEYPLDLSSFKEGDVVECTYLDGYLHGYMIKIVKIKQ